MRTVGICLLIVAALTVGCARPGREPESLVGPPANRTEAARVIQDPRVYPIDGIWIEAVITVDPSTQRLHFAAEVHDPQGGHFTLPPGAAEFSWSFCQVRPFEVTIVPFDGWSTKQPRLYFWGEGRNEVQLLTRSVAAPDVVSDTTFYSLR